MIPLVIKITQVTVMALVKIVPLYASYTKQSNQKGFVRYIYTSINISHVLMSMYMYVRVYLLKQDSCRDDKYNY